MEENPRPPRPKKRTHKAEPAESATQKPPPTETRGCSVDCSGQSCRSCSAAMLADCVALCCCPLAVVSLLGLAFIKVPCAMGKRCFGRKKKKGKQKMEVCVDSVSRKESGSVRGNEKGSIVKGEEFGVKSVNAFEGEIMEQGNLCGEVIEGDNELLEMCQVGHLGFGRVSYTGSGTHSPK